MTFYFICHPVGKESIYKFGKLGLFSNNLLASFLIRTECALPLYHESLGLTASNPAPWLEHRGDV
jgi:hypothetical protein